MRKKRILVVEDDLVIRDVVDDVLAEVGFDVIPATSGKQALDYLRDDEPPDLVILDLMLPLVSGWQVMEHLRSEARLMRVPVIVTTAVSADRPRGATTVLPKPFTVRALLEAVASAVPTDGESQRPGSPG
jgi:two-component system, OmpR family, response regulator CpxR